MTRNRGFGPLAALVALAVQPAGAIAQVPADTVRIEELVVSATRVALPRAMVSSSVTVLEGAELRARGVMHVQEALREVAGMHVVQSGARGATTSLFLRGGESDYVKILVDGIPLNEPGGRADLANLTTDNIERIEVVRGPGSVLFGSDAVAGIVHIFTREGRGQPQFGAGVRGGTYGTLAYDAELAGEAGAARYTLSASRSLGEGIYEFNNEYENTTLSAHVGLRPDRWTDAALTVRYSDSEFHYPTDGAGVPVDKNAFQLEERIAVGLEAGRWLTDRLEARLQLTTSGITAGIDDQPDGPADTLGTFFYESRDRLRRSGFDARANLHLSPTTILTAGWGVEAQRLRSTNAYDSEWGPDGGSFDADRSSRGYYVQALTDVRDRLALSAGARIDDNDAFGAFRTFRAGAVYRLDRTGTRLRLSAGTAFKEPTFLENYGTGYVMGNPELEPEHSRSWEAGVEQALAAGRVSFAATYFAQTFKDMIQYKGQPWGSTEPNYFNVARATAAGWELELRARATTALAVSAGYTRLHSRVRDAGFQSGPDAEFVHGRRLLRRPDDTANLGLAYQLLGRGTLEATLHHIGERDDLDFSGAATARRALPSYTRLDLAGQTSVFSARGRRPGLALTARIDNVLDERYSEIIHFRAPGRALLIGARLGFDSHEGTTR